MIDRHSLFVTGATGLVGRGVLEVLRSDPRVDRVHALVRSPEARVGLSASGRSAAVTLVSGDVTRPGLGIDDRTRARLAGEVTTVIHLAANTSFSQPLGEARAVNRDGTLHLLDLTAGWPRVDRWVYVSTAFVAGARTGAVREDDPWPEEGWVNSYEQSKAEAEALVRAARQDWVIVRPATIVCDDLGGTVTQINAVHRALRLYFGGLAAMLPGADDSALDAVTTEYVADGVARLALATGIERQAFHLCAGAGAMPLDELLDVTHGAFAASPAWRRRGIARPLRTDLETYRVFERAVEDVGSERVRRAVRSLGFFVPQLAHQKRFDTTRADAVLGARAAAVAEFWGNMVRTLAGCEAGRTREAA